MRRALRLWMFVTVLSGLLAEPPLWAAAFIPKKGPILHRLDDKLIVRLQERKFLSPVVEWREKPEGEAKKSEMKADTDSFWESDLSSSAVEYRIVDGDRATAWYPIVQPSSKESFAFAAYGDNRSGWGNNAVHRAILANMEKESPAFIIHTGDIVYRGDQESQWSLFFAQGRKLFASIPFQPSIGNHDLSRRNLYGRYFTSLAGEGEPYYYFRFGRAHFVALDTTRDFSPKCPQYQFLKETLEKIKGESPIVVFFHLPAYSFSYHSGDSKVQAHLVPLFEKYGVDLVLTGHDHNYQRIGPINGVTYIVTGGGGGPLYDVRDNPLHQYYKVVHHYLVLEVGEKSMTGVMKYRKEVADDRFEIPYEKKKDEPLNPKEQRVIEKLKP